MYSIQPLCQVVPPWSRVDLDVVPPRYSNPGTAVASSVHNSPDKLREQANDPKATFIIRGEWRESGQNETWGNQGAKP